jgi:6-phosphogluconolactonase (cycloisomerase 2 family)
VHCAELSYDAYVYACDRVNDRIQVFTKEGKFVKEVFVERNTLGDGSVWDIAFSKDPQQKYFYLADGANEKVHVFDRQSMTELTSFGDGGRQPGQDYSHRPGAARRGANHDNLLADRRLFFRQLQIP